MHTQGADSYTPLVLFDGECAVCDATVQFILERDHSGRFHFAPLQGETAQVVLARHPELPRDLDSLVLVDQRPDGSEVVTWHSSAVIGIAERLGGGWALASALRVIPAVLRDPFYRAFAAVRYKVFGRLDSCRIPEADWEARFLA